MKHQHGTDGAAQAGNGAALAAPESVSMDANSNWPPAAAAVAVVAAAVAVAAVVAAAAAAAAAVVVESARAGCGAAGDCAGKCGVPFQRRRQLLRLLRPSIQSRNPTNEMNQLHKHTAPSNDWPQLTR